jgi:hypothetical protein
MKKLITVDFLISDSDTKAIHSCDMGRARRKPSDKSDKSIGMIVSLARLLKISEDKVSRIIDILYGDDLRRIEEFSCEELIIELQRQ